MTKWPLVPLGNVLQLQRRWVKVDPMATYEEIGVRCFGNGIFHKAPIDGSTLGNKRVLRIEPGDLVFNNVFAWEGAVAVASDAEAGKIGSHRFVTYTADHNRCSVDYLRWFFRSEPGLEVLRRVSPGSAGRNRTMSLDQLPKQEVPLPPLTEQVRIVDRLDSLSAKIAEATQLRAESDASRIHLWLSVVEEAFKALAKHSKPISTILTRIKREVVLQPGRDYFPAGLTNQAKGIIAYPPIASTDTKYPILFSIDTGDLVYSKLKVWEGSLAIVGHNNSGRVVSSEFPMFRVDYAQVENEYLDLWMRRPSLWAWLGEQVRGIGGRKIRVDEATFLRAPIPLPPIEVQRSVSSQLQQFRQSTVEVKQLQRETDIAMNAIMPALLDQVFNEGGESHA
jgi:type I restriction enzyme S subunit